MIAMIPAAATIAAGVSWIAAMDRMAERREPWSARLSAYLAFVLLVVTGGYGIVHIHSEIEPWSQVLAAAMYTAVEAAGAVMGYKAWRCWRV